MRAPRGEEGGIPRVRGILTVPPGSASGEEHWGGASKAKTEKLRRNELQRRARSRGFQLRHSAYGYSLVDPARKPVDDRNDMTLDEVQSWLERA